MYRALYRHLSPYLSCSTYQLICCVCANLLNKEDLHTICMHVVTYKYIMSLIQVIVCEGHYYVVNTKFRCVVIIEGSKNNHYTEATNSNAFLKWQFG